MAHPKDMDSRKFELIRRDFSVRAKDCERRIDYGDHFGPGCDAWDPCDACMAAKKVVADTRSRANTEAAEKWLAGMRAYDKKMRLRQVDPGPASAYPTGLQQLERCILTPKF